MCMSINEKLRLFGCYVSVFNDFSVCLWDLLTFALSPVTHSIGFFHLNQSSLTKDSASKQNKGKWITCLGKIRKKYWEEPKLILHYLDFANDNVSVLTSFFSKIFLRFFYDAHRRNHRNTKHWQLLLALDSMHVWVWAERV